MAQPAASPRSGEKGDGNFDLDPELTLNSIVKSKTINFPIRGNYTNWEAREASRFRVIREESTTSDTTEIVYKVPRPGKNEADECLGFIRFHGTNIEGTIEITNRNATLQPRHLDIGGTTKGKDTRQAGAHGEGLKVGLLVLMRGAQNHNVRCCTSGFNWRFNFTTRGRLVARLYRMSQNGIARTENEAHELLPKTLLPFAPKPGADVQFVIGEQSTLTARDQAGQLVERRPVRREDFNAWVKSALFLHPAFQSPGGIISTEKGDLLIDQDLRGKLFLKGLLLRESTPERSASITNLPLRYGYNFASGRTNRDRQSVAGADQEARAILDIWDRALRAKPEMVAELNEILNDEETRFADYYCSDEKSKNPRVDRIIDGLGHEGIKLNNDYWGILRHHHLIRTAEEEQSTRFRAAPSEPVDKDGDEFVNLLQACFRACPETNGAEIRFTPEPMFCIHERWLCRLTAEEAFGLDDSTPWLDVLFHTVRMLFQLALREMEQSLRRTTVNFTERSDSPNWQRLEIARTDQRLQCFRDMGDIEWEWERSPEGSGIEIWVTGYQWGIGEGVVEVQCHNSARCSGLWNSLPFLAGDAAEGSPCRAARFSTGERQSHIERNLDENEEYFFIVLDPKVDTSIVTFSDNIACPTRRLPPPSPSPLPSPGPALSQPNFPSALNKRPATSIVMGSKLQDLRGVFTVGGEWYNGTDSNNKKVVIGILPDAEAELKEEDSPRKRRRER
ncbi:hypothetical protein B0T16DRAFT_435518 [Cercophora newfieldiana]|uniref:Uncharacterized protein n=1 Tax=Cercophora newfieldiana TaxID=92897 RepID=A0AA39YK70_9PEZI|nr:hypothetical protein B0T16DRAFT_435518 [Cercophora newfieldiana]